MKKRLLYVLMATLFAITLSSCDKSKEKYTYLAKLIPLSFATVDVGGSATMTPERFSSLLGGSDFNLYHTQRTDDGIINFYTWNNDKYPLSEDEEFYCCAAFDYNRNSSELTIAGISMTYESSSARKLDEFYHHAMLDLLPLMTKWGFEKNESESDPSCQYYFKGKESISISKDAEQVLIIRGYPE